MICRTTERRSASASKWPIRRGVKDLGRARIGVLRPAAPDGGPLDRSRTGRAGVVGRRAGATDGVSHALLALGDPTGIRRSRPGAPGRARSCEPSAAPSRRSTTCSPAARPGRHRPAGAAGAPRRRCPAGGARPTTRAQRRTTAFGDLGIASGTTRSGVAVARTSGDCAPRSLPCGRGGDASAGTCPADACGRTYRSSSSS